MQGVAQSGVFTNLRITSILATNTCHVTDTGRSPASKFVSFPSVADGIRLDGLEGKDRGQGSRVRGVIR